MQVQFQVKTMREQLQIKKQKMIDELRELRKEYALSKDKDVDFESLHQKFHTSNNLSNLTAEQRTTGGASHSTKYSSVKNRKFTMPASSKQFDISSNGGETL